MSGLFIGRQALYVLKEKLAKENAEAVRIFTAGGGCCGRFEICPVQKPLTNDAIYIKGGVTVYIERDIVDSTSAISIRFDEHKGLLIHFIE